MWITRVTPRPESPVGTVSGFPCSFLGAHGHHEPNRKSTQDHSRTDFTLLPSRDSISDCLCLENPRPRSTVLLWTGSQDETLRSFRVGVRRPVPSGTRSDLAGDDRGTSVLWSGKSRWLISTSLVPLCVVYFQTTNCCRVERDACVIEKFLQ